MHQDYERANKWSSKVIAAAIEVHRIKGPGLIELIFMSCLPEPRRALLGDGQGS